MNTHLQDLNPKAGHITHQSHKFYMLFALSLMFLGLPVVGVAESPPTTATATKAKSKLNTQIYEKAEETDSFTDEVSLIRSMAGETQVKFKTKPGFYRLPEGDIKMQGILGKAQKAKKAVSVKADGDSKMIQDVGFDGI